MQESVIHVSFSRTLAKAILFAEYPMTSLESATGRPRRVSSRRSCGHNTSKNHVLTTADMQLIGPSREWYLWTTSTAITMTVMGTCTQRWSRVMPLFVTWWLPRLTRFSRAIRSWSQRSRMPWWRSRTTISSKPSRMASSVKDLVRCKIPENRFFYAWLPKQFVG